MSLDRWLRPLPWATVFMAALTVLALILLAPGQPQDDSELTACLASLEANRDATVQADYDRALGDVLATVGTTDDLAPKVAHLREADAALDAARDEFATRVRQAVDDLGGFLSECRGT